MRWNENFTKKFVKIYLKHECLWNPNHPDYKLRFLRIKAYEAIASEFNAYSSIGLTIPEIKVKIKNLRTTYIQEVHKILSKSTPDAMYKPSLVWFKDMDRCLKYVPSRNSTVFTGPDIPVTDTSSEIWVQQQAPSTAEIDSDPLVPQTDDEYDTSKQETILQFKNERVSPVIFKKVKKRKLKRRGTSIADYIDTSVEPSSSTHENEDEFDIYGKFIASQLRSMDLQKALRIQMEIHSLVNEARMSDISNE